jgi:hypothetical protein
MDKKKYGFIHIPKTGGSSIKKIIEMSDKSDIIYLGHNRIIDIQNTDLNYVTLVRNPYDRLVSAYFYLDELIKSKEIDGTIYTKDEITNILSIENLKFTEEIESCRDFKEFVMKIESEKLIENTLHIKPMHYWIGDANEIKIFKIDDINNIAIEFFKNLGIEKINEIKINTSKHGNYKEYLDAEIISEINKIYELDFKLFNYEKL